MVEEYPPPPPPPRQVRPGDLRPMREGDPPTEPIHAVVPPAFAAALASLTRPEVPPGIRLREIPGPKAMAPFTIALEGDLWPDLDNLHDDDDDVDPAATGRFVVLYNPVGEAAWQGVFRVITMVSAELDPQLADDPMFDAVAWSWLTELLRDVEHGALSGTVTRVLSTSFGEIDGAAAELELRASWTPADSDMAGHLAVWTALLAQAAGMAVLPEGVTPLRTRRRPGTAD